MRMLDMQTVWEASPKLLTVAFAPAMLAIIATVIERCLSSAPLQSPASAISGHLSAVVCATALASLSRARASALYGVIGWIYGLFAFAVHVVVAHEGAAQVVSWL